MRPNLLPKILARVLGTKEILETFYSPITSEILNFLCFTLIIIGEVAVKVLNDVVLLTFLLSI